MGELDPAVTVADAAVVELEVLSWPLEHAASVAVRTTETTATDIR